MKVKTCAGCGLPIGTRDEIGINKKLLGEATREYYCLSCLADYFEVTVEEILDKIVQFKLAGCKYFD